MRPPDVSPAPTASDPSGLQEFLLVLGSALTTAGAAVSDVQSHLHEVATAYGWPDPRIAVFSTFITIALDPREPVTLEITRQLPGLLRLDQTSALFDVLRRAKRAEVEPAEGIREVGEVLDMPARFNRTLTVVGHVVLVVGICLILQPTWDDIAVAAFFGLVIGLLKLAAARSLRLLTILPVMAAVIVSTATFFVADRGWIDADLRAMIAPLVTFLPGAALTMAVIELSAAELITGASRLVNGGVQLIMLGFGIAAGAQIVGRTASVTLLTKPQNLVGWWAPWVGVLVFGIGVWLHESAPRRSFPWLILVLFAAWTGQYLGGEAFGGYISGFTGALAMTVVALAVERLPSGPPSLVSFLPGFWLLVPGALGLISVTEYLSSNLNTGLADLIAALAAIASVAVGVLCAYPLVGSLNRAYRQVAGRRHS